MVEKVYLVKKYRRFPKMMFQDKTVETFDNLMEAQAFSMRMNKAEDGERYYVMDDPHEWVELSEDQKRYIRKLQGRNE